MHLPAPMLSRPGQLPGSGRWAYEPKWDGFRALVSTCFGLHVESRNGWNMTKLLPELQTLPHGLILDGELVALTGNDGAPHFPDVARRLLHNNTTIPLVYVIFDVLHEDGGSVLHWPYKERRALLESLNLNSDRWHTTPSFDDGEALHAAMCERGLEGTIAKHTEGLYKPGARDWIKIKNPAYWRRLPQADSPARLKRLGDRDRAPDLRRVRHHSRRRCPRLARLAHAGQNTSTPVDLALLAGQVGAPVASIVFRARAAIRARSTNVL